MSFYDPNKEGAKGIFVYSLSTCNHCQQAKKLFDDLGVGYDFLAVDLLDGPEQQVALEELGSYNPAQTFPTTICRGRVVVGFLKDDLSQLAAKA